MKEEIMKTCELCGFSFNFNERFKHECDPAVLANKAEQEEKWRRDEIDQLEAGEMYLRDFI